MIFAGCVLMTLILGTRIHSAMQTSADRAYYSRTALSYISQKIRSADSDSYVSVGSFGGEDALFLTGRYDGREYETVIYSKNGMIKELLREKDADLGADAGNDVIECSALSFKTEGGLITVFYTDPEGNETSACIYLRSGGVGDED